MKTSAQQGDQYASYHDGSFCKDKEMLSSEVAVQLYTDLANPLGTSRKTKYAVFTGL